MNLKDNPLYLLKASIRDDKSTLMNLFEDYSLLNDNDQASKYINELTSPRGRLSIEASWLLGINGGLIKDFIYRLGDIEFVLNSESLNALSKANLLASSIELSNDLNKEKIIDVTIALSHLTEDIQADEVQILINQERKHSRFPPVESLSSIELEIENRNSFYKKVIINLIDNILSKEIVEVVTTVVELDTNNGNKHCSTLVKEVISYYEIKVQDFLTKEEDNIDKVLSIISTDLDNSVSEKILSTHIDEMIRIVRNWDFVAQPIQLLCMSQGLSHDKSNNLAYKIRDLSISLFNKYNNVELTKKLNNELKNVFAEDYEIKEKIEKDLYDIDEILEDRQLAKENNNKFAEEITYQVEIGVVFRDKFYINPEIIEWKHRVLKISDVKKLKWGAVSNNSGTEYRISFSSNNKEEKIITRRKSIFSNIIDRLWKTAGLNILFQYLSILESGENIVIGGVVISDHGLILEKYSLLSNNKKEFVTWDNVELYSINGNLYISKIGDGKMNCVLSYLDIDNVHILESMIRILFKTSCSRLSDAIVSN